MEAKYRGAPCELPVVLIGHSKLFTRDNARSLTTFLQFVRGNAGRFAFGTFRDLDTDVIRRSFHEELAHDARV